jgi:hypothetical protein
MPPDLKTVEQLLLQQESHYIDGWIAESEQWEQIGLYTEIAQMVGPKDGGYYLDVGSGVGHQSVYMTGVNPESNNMGMEGTRFLTALAQKHWSEQGLPVSGYINGEISLTKDDKIYYERPSIVEPQLLASLRKAYRENILYVTDNILYPRIVPAVLGNEKLDGATFSMPGVPLSMLFQWPHRITDRLTEKTHPKRLKEVMTQVRMAAYHNVSQWTAPKGRFAITERIAIDSEVDKSDAVALISDSMGRYGQYWSFTDARITDPIEGNSPLNWGGIVDAQMSVPKEVIESLGAQSHALIVLLTRNTTAFNENPLPEPEAK